jgi:cytochrome c biogenesis protein CcdA
VVDLLAIAFLGGFITGISPCIVPVLPVVVAGGSTGTSRARPFLIIAGLVVSFSLTELVGSTVLSAIGLPQNLLFWLGIAL